MMMPNESSNWLLELQRDLQSLRLELAETKTEVDRLNGELDRLRYSYEESSNEQVRQHVESLFAYMALPLVHLLTQSILFEELKKDIHPRDVFSTVKRLTKVLSQHGLEPFGTYGQIEAYDMDRHAPLGSEDIQPGEKVRLRLVGLQYQGKILRKATVEKAEV